MKNKFKIITILNPVILLYWISTKFININEDIILRGLYEMTSLLFVACALLLPVFIIIMLITNRKELKRKHIVYGSLMFLFSVLNVFVMTWELK